MPGAARSDAAILDRIKGESHWYLVLVGDSDYRHILI